MVVATRKKSKYNSQIADRVVNFFKNLKHSTGEYGGQPFDLMPWQENEIIRPLFGTLNADGTRQYRTCYVEVPRKNGKTELGAGVGLYLLFADNEQGAQIYSAAGDRMQAGLIYSAAAPMVRQSTVLSRLSKIIDSQKRIVSQSTNSYYQVLSAEAYSKHGINAHGILFDELHTQPSRDLWDVLTTSQGSRRQPLIFVMTTAGYDRNSIGWEIHDYACKVKDGIIEDPTFLPVIYSAPEEADWTDEDVWYSCNPALGAFRSIDEMRMLCARAKEIPAMEMTFRRLYLNQWVNSVTRWLPMDKWDECLVDYSEEDLAGQICYASADLSSTTDLTSMNLVFPHEDGTFSTLPYFWIPEDKMREKERKERVPYSQWVREGLVYATPGNVIDYDYIRETIKQKRQKFDIREVAYDRVFAGDIFAQGLSKDGFSITPEDIRKNPSIPSLVPFGQGYLSMSPPTKELMTLVLQKRIRQNGNPVLRWNADNLVVTQDPAGNLKPDKAKATQKIDGMVALIMALDRATRHADDISVYENRGLLTI